MNNCMKRLSKLLRSKNVSINCREVVRSIFNREDRRRARKIYEEEVD